MNYFSSSRLWPSRLRPEFGCKKGSSDDQIDVFNIVLCYYYQMIPQGSKSKQLEQAFNPWMVYDFCHATNYFSAPLSRLVLMAKLVCAKCQAPADMFADMFETMFILSGQHNIKTHVRNSCPHPMFHAMYLKIVSALIVRNGPQLNFCGHCTFAHTNLGTFCRCCHRSFPSSSDLVSVRHINYDRTHSCICLKKQHRLADLLRFKMKLEARGGAPGVHFPPARQTLYVGFPKGQSEVTIG